MTRVVSALLLAGLLAAVALAWAQTEAALIFHRRTDQHGSWLADASQWRLVSRSLRAGLHVESISRSELVAASTIVL